MSRFGDFYENRITSERVVVLRGDEDAAPGERGFGYLTVAPGGAVAGEHPGLLQLAMLAREFRDVIVSQTPL